MYRIFLIKVGQFVIKSLFSTPSRQNTNSNNDLLNVGRGKKSVTTLHCTAEMSFYLEKSCRFNHFPLIFHFCKYTMWQFEICLKIPVPNRCYGACAITFVVVYSPQQQRLRARHHLKGPCSLPRGSLWSCLEPAVKGPGCGELESWVAARVCARFNPVCHCTLTFFFFSHHIV